MATKQKYPPVYLNNDLYDALHLSALALGGVGGGMRWEAKLEGDGHYQNYPFCISGHALCATNERVSLDNLIERNDDVTSANRRTPWDTYVRKMNLHPMREKPVRAA